MKKVLLLLALIMPICVFSQNVYKEYCSLKFDSGGFGKSYASVNYGEGFAPIKGEDGKRINFKSEIEAINYMSKKGWELEPISIWYQGNTGKYYEFVMSRKKNIDDTDIKEEDEIKSEE